MGAYSITSRLLLLITVTLATFPHPISAGKPPELHPKIKTQAHITFYCIKIINYTWYEIYSEKLRDHNYLIGLTN